mgnify:CR=1 FL=1
MFSEQYKNLINRNINVLKIVWILLFVGMVFYLLLSFIFNSNQQVRLSRTENIFIIIGTVISIISYFAYKRLLSENFLRRYLSTQSLDFHDNEKDLVVSLSSKEKKLYKLLNHLIVPHIIVWGLNEAIVLIGFVLSYITKNFESIIPFALAGILLQVYMYPKVNKIMEKAVEWEELDS